MEEIKNLLESVLNGQDKILEEIRELRKFSSDKFWDLHRRMPTEEDRRANHTAELNRLSSETRENGNG